MNNYREFQNNALIPVSSVPRCPVMLVLDTSHSMWGSNLTDLQNSLKDFFQSVNNNHFIHGNIDIACISMGDNLCMLEEFTPIKESKLQYMQIRPKGDTPIAAALSLALEKINSRQQYYTDINVPCITPQLILLSDGKSSDDTTLIQKELSELFRNKKIYIRAIAIGSSPDWDTLRCVSNEVVVPKYCSMREAFADTGYAISETYEDEMPAAVMASESASEIHYETEYLLDASNILHWDNNTPKLDCVLAITRALENAGAKYIAVFDASARHKLTTAADRQHLERLFQNDPQHFTQVPAGSCTDEFLLMRANRNIDSVIITNDNFRNYKENYPWVCDKSRVIKGMALIDTVYIPKLKLQIPLK